MNGNTRKFPVYGLCTRITLYEPKTFEFCLEKGKICESVGKPIFFFFKFHFIFSSLNVFG